MSAARIAEPGERFILLGADAVGIQGTTGRVVRYATPAETALGFAYAPRSWAPFYVVTVDDRPHPGNGTPPDGWVTARRWCYVITPDGDAAQDEDAQPVREDLTA